MRLEHKIALIGIIIAALITILVAAGFFTFSDIRFTRQSFTDNVCPNSISPYSAGEIKLLFDNIGNRNADLFVKLSSSDNIQFIKSSDGINMPVNSGVTTLTFLINTSSLKTTIGDVIGNLTIDIDAQYTSNALGMRNTLNCVCKYEKENSELRLKDSC
ncbi:MAG: hypothetical protein KKB25_01255 [Nanoarchaeota archaeon]|nr:hypothetical protein [Nanoarchaeota archaeon]